jgi:hypothetical protein
MKAKKCGYCGSINTPEARRCLRCGTNITSAVVSDGYERELVLTSDDRIVSISSSQNPPPAEQPRFAANPMSAGPVRLERVTAQTAAGRRGKVSDEDEREMPARKHRTKTSSNSESNPVLEPVPPRTPTALIHGARLLGWLLLFGTLAAAAFMVKRFGFTPDANASLAGLLALDHWDPYWAAAAGGVALLGVVAFVLLLLGAAIVENLAVIRAELHDGSGREPEGESSDTAKAAAEQRPATPAPSLTQATDSAALSDQKAGKTEEPAISLSADQFLEPEKDVYGTLEPLVAAADDDDQGDRRKEPTLGA